MGRTPSDVDCGFVTVDLSAYGTYFVVVTGALKKLCIFLLFSPLDSHRTLGANPRRPAASSTQTNPHRHPPGAAPDEEGIFELSVMCTPAPIVELEDTCAYNYIECGDVTLGKNVGFPDWAGYPSGGALVSIVGSRGPLRTSRCTSRTPPYDATP